MATPLRPIRRTITRPGRRIQRGLRLLRPHDGPTGSEPPRDVWRWTDRKYRVRAIVLLLVNVVLFAGLGFFTYWLRTGDFTPFANRPYSHLWWEAFNPTGTQQISLTDFLLKPIPVDQVPLMMIVVSLVLASLTAIPILVSMLYRFPFSLPFVAIIGFVAVFPWLAITVTFCCYLARLRPLRFNFRLATALISYLPVVVYYAMAAQDKADAAHLTPLNMAKLYLPWILAMTFACLLMGTVLLIARLVNYRPGAIAPLMTVMFALPVLLFEAKVGRDELYYRLLQTHYGASSFPDHLDLDRLAERLAERRHDLGSGPETAEQIALEIQLRAASGQPQSDDLSALLNEDLGTHQSEVVAECRDFRRRYPQSRYVANTLYLEGQALDTRIDPDYVVFHGGLYLRYYQEFPWRASEPVWKDLHQRFRESPFAAIASLRLALLRVRSGQVDEAIALLNDVIDHPSSPDPSTRPTGWSDVLAKRPAASGLIVDLDGTTIEARKLLALLQSNRDPQQADRALAELFSLDPRHPMYGANLRRLLDDVPRRFPLTTLRDNLLVLVARSQPSPSRRIEELRACIDQLSRLPDTDALPHARYELALAYQEDKRREEARATFDQVKTLHPNSPWAAEAGRRIAAMGAASRG